jgi:hypothetical protein
MKSEQWFGLYPLVLGIMCYVITYFLFKISLSSWKEDDRIEKFGDLFGPIIVSLLSTFLFVIGILILLGV